MSREPSQALMKGRFDAPHDFPLYKRAPQSQLMIASIPRSGSTAFCNDLWNTGVLGAPMEYLNLKWIEKQGRWSGELSDLMEYWKQVQGLRTSPNGVFSYKMFLTNYFSVLEKSPSLLSLLAPTHVVYFTRDNVVAQAVSYARAMKSQEWFDGGGGLSMPYDKSQIDEARDLIIYQRERWERLFAITKAEIMRLTYEEYLEDRVGTVPARSSHPWRGYCATSMLAFIRLNRC